ncbi:hypothetical protein B0H14DRAFT_3719729 [Mycena olivaceomarginata]|nr:hypothetical protein B0H14DRAFT_3719729 [Mycena olivaceomarginata]
MITSEPSLFMLIFTARYGLFGAGWRLLVASAAAGLTILELMWHIHPATQKIAHLILYSTDFFSVALYFPSCILLRCLFSETCFDCLEPQIHGPQTKEEYDTQCIAKRIVQRIKPYAAWPTRRMTFVLVVAGISDLLHPGERVPLVEGYGDGYTALVGALVVPWVIPVVVWVISTHVIHISEKMKAERVVKSWDAERQTGTKDKEGAGNVERNVAVAQDLKKSDAAEVQEDGSLKDGEMAEKAENGMNAAKETEVIGSQ